MFTTQQSKHIIENTFNLWFDIKVMRINTMYEYINVCNKELI